MPSKPETVKSLAAKMESFAKESLDADEQRALADLFTVARGAAKAETASFSAARDSDVAKSMEMIKAAGVNPDDKEAIGPTITLTTTITITASHPWITCN